jgi:hypothetical protein
MEETSRNGIEKFSLSRVSAWRSDRGSLCEIQSLSFCFLYFFPNVSTFFSPSIFIQVINHSFIPLILFSYTGNFVKACLFKILFFYQFSCRSFIANPVPVLCIVSGLDGSLSFLCCQVTLPNTATRPLFLQVIVLWTGRKHTADGEGIYVDTVRLSTGLKLQGH